MNNVIILNKMFEGSWNGHEGNISHEIIDFALTDEGKYFVYNVPYGCCPDWIHIKGDKNQEKETHEAEYLYLTSESKNGLFEIKYRIKLKRKIHSFPYYKSEKLRKQVSDEMEKIYENEKIFYGGKKISHILDTDTPLVTFEAEKIEAPDRSATIKLSQYNYQRNKGYLKEDEFTEDYKRFQKKDDEIGWLRVNLGIIRTKPHFEWNYSIKKTFLDLILKTESEECYTNMLYSILKYPGVFEKFCKTFASDCKIDYNHSFQVFREYGIFGGRMDICAESSLQRVIIENKLFSGLNGIKKDEKTQLSSYYEWGAKAYMKPICFLTVPDFRAVSAHSGRLSKIESEIDIYDPGMLLKYIIIPYGKISEFIKINRCLFDEYYEYYRYLDDIIDAFNNYAYTSKVEYVEALFKQRINEVR